VRSGGTTACLDIDRVLGGCMSIDPQHGIDPFRVNCDDTLEPHRQRATQALTDVARRRPVRRRPRLRPHPSPIHGLLRERGKTEPQKILTKPAV
jgi:hypothetical protein